MPRNAAVNSSFWDQLSGTRLSRAGREAISFWVTLSKWQVILLLIPLLPREAHGNRYPCECQRIWLSYLQRLGLLPALSQMECIQIKAPWHRPPSLERLPCKGNGISPKLWRYYFLIFLWSISPNVAARMGAATHLHQRWAGGGAGSILGLACFLF